MTLTKISTGGVKDDAADESKLKISNAPSNGKFLQYKDDTDKLTWADSASEGTEVKSTGETSNNKYLKADGDGTCSWQDPGIVYAAKAGTEFTGAGVGLKGANQLKFYDPGDSSNFIHLKAQALTANTTFLLPTTDGSAGQYLKTDGSGVLSFSTVTVPPAGNTLDLLADGAIAAGKPVIIKSNGKAEQVKLTVTERTSQNSTPAGSAQASSAVDHTGKSTEFGNLGVVWSATSNVGGYFFREVNTGANLQCMDFAAYSAGNAVKPETGNIQVVATNGSEITAVWDSSTDNFVVAYRRDSNNRIEVTWTDINPNNTRRLAPHGSADEVEATSSVYPRLCDCGSGRILIVWTENTGNYKVQGRFYVWNGSSDYVLGPVFDINSSSGGGSSSKREWVDVTYDSNSGKVVATWLDPNNSDGNKGAAAVGTISGSGSSTTATWGTQVTHNTNTVSKQRIITDDSAGKVLLSYLSTTNIPRLCVRVGTISGTSISFGSEAELDGNRNPTDSSYFTDLVYMPSLQKSIAVFSVKLGSNHYPRTKTIAISGTSVTQSNEFAIAPHGSGGQRFMALAWMGNNNLSTVFLGCSNADDNHRGEFRTLHMSTSSTNLTSASQNFLGFAEDAISDGNTGTIKLSGNVVGNQSGLTPATWYAVQDDGTLSAGGSSSSSGGLAVASDKLRIKDVPKS